MSAVRPVNSVDFFCTKALGVFFATVGGMHLVQFPSYYRSEVAFEANAISATGTVIKTREEKHYSGGGGIAPMTTQTEYISTVEFQTHRGELVDFTTSSACSSQQHCENKTVQVRYDPSVPTQARIDSDTPLNVRVWGYVAFFLFFFLIGIMLLVIDIDDRTRPSRTTTKTLKG